ncbi:SPOR domain-containing protein [Marinobacterium jannaschii]|uniref:SPOR domain-containing protein n=1 Tax=Marinobacterium jannaschii TaxID=64970 RepID=UPI000685A8CA|nr:SPOR domain-containing protein [Marinobacterium jannaschii]
MAARKDFASRPKKSNSASRSAPKKAAPAKRTAPDKAKAPARKAPAKRSNNDKAAAAARPERRPLPLGKLVITLALAGGLGYLLYSLTQVSPTAPKPQSVELKPKPKPLMPEVKKQPVVEAQGDDKTRFEFYKMLPESEVTTSDPSKYKSTPKAEKTKYKYLLQTGSFRSAADADRMRANLLLQGLPNVHTSKSVSSNGTTWYRVRTGPFDSRSRLNKAYDKLVRMNIEPMQIRQ